MSNTKESKIANLIGTLLILLVIPIAIVALTIAIKANINHDTLPDFLGYKPLIVGSNSMEDVFEVGDLTISLEVEEDELEVGDIISFWDSEGDTVITHRIAEITTEENGETIYITKGDMNDEVDEEAVTFSQIEGKYVWHIKYIGKIILWLQEPQGLIIAFLLPLVVCILIYNHISKRNKIKLARAQKLSNRLISRSKEEQALNKG